MVRKIPSASQNFLSSVILPCLSIPLLPVSLALVACCVLNARLNHTSHESCDRSFKSAQAGCVIVSGGKMSKGLMLARAFKRAGWTVIGVEEEGWGELCPLRFSKAVDHFYLLPSAAVSYERYSERLLAVAQSHSATLFIPVSGVVSCVDDARAADSLFVRTDGTCRTFIQDPETMLDLHDKDRFIALVDRLGLPTPDGRMITSVEDGMAYLKADATSAKYVLKCMGIDENRGDMTLFPLRGDDEKLSRTKAKLESLTLAISKDCPYVFQEFIPGQEWCTHASVVDGKITSFVTCPSNDMLMTYEDHTSEPMGVQAEDWTRTFLERLAVDPTATGKSRRLTGHFSFDLISSTTDGQLYPIECNARVHTAVILLPMDDIAGCYSTDAVGTLRPDPRTAPRTWLYNDLVMRYLPLLVPSRRLLAILHPSLPACLVDTRLRQTIKPSEQALQLRLESTLVADDWLPFIALWHLWWPMLLITRWWQGKRWTRLNASTGRIFEA